MLIVPPFVYKPPPPRLAELPLTVLLFRLTVPVEPRKMPPLPRDVSVSLVVTLLLLMVLLLIVNVPPLMEIAPPFSPLLLVSFTWLSETVTLLRVRLPLALLIAQLGLAPRFDDPVGRARADAGNLQQGGARCAVDLDRLVEVALGPGLLGGLVAREQSLLVKGQLVVAEAVVAQHEVGLVQPQRAGGILGRCIGEG